MGEGLDEDSSPTHMLEFGHLTHPGLTRELNEDTYYGDARLGLWLVADGMGGHAHGELASAIAREAIVREVRRGTELEQAIRVADQDIQQFSHQRPAPRPMGTTVVAATIRDLTFQIAWVGDSRGYLWRDGRLTRLSRDHTYIQTLIQQGIINQAQARRHPQRNLVTQALGVTAPEQLNVDTLSGAFTPGSQLLLCSDGLTEDVRDAQVAGILANTGWSAQECVDALIAAALDNGGADNITAILIRQD